MLLRSNHYRFLNGQLVNSMLSIKYNQYSDIENAFKLKIHYSEHTVCVKHSR